MKRLDNHECLPYLHCENYPYDTQVTANYVKEKLSLDNVFCDIHKDNIIVASLYLMSLKYAK